MKGPFQSPPLSAPSITPSLFCYSSLPEESPSQFSPHAVSVFMMHSRITLPTCHDLPPLCHENCSLSSMLAEDSVRALDTVSVIHW